MNPLNGFPALHSIAIRLVNTGGGEGFLFNCSIKTEEIITIAYHTMQGWGYSITNVTLKLAVRAGYMNSNL